MAKPSVLDSNISVSKAVAVMMRHGIEGGASSIHIEPDRGYSRIRFRFGSTLKTSLLLPIELHEPLLNRLKLMSRLFIDEDPMPQHGTGKIQVDGQDLAFSIATMPVGDSEKVVIHLPTNEMMSLAALGFRSMNMDRLRKVLGQPSGFLALAGPVGAGKTTSGYAALQYRQQKGVAVASVEAPVKRFLPNVAQMSLSRSGNEVATAVASMLRQEHQTLFSNVGGTGTLSLLLRAGVVGKYVISSLHSQSTYAALTGLISESSAHNVATSLNGVVTQALVPRLCTHCQGERNATREEIAWIQFQIKSAPAGAIPQDVWRSRRTQKVGEAVGCKACYGTGYRGKVLLSEILYNTPELKQYIALNTFNTKDLRDGFRRQRALTIGQDGALAVSEMETTPEMLWEHLPASAIALR